MKKGGMLNAKELKQEETFLLRKWRLEGDETWRFSVKSITSGEIYFFHASDALMAFLTQGDFILPHSNQVFEGL